MIDDGIIYNGRVFRHYLYEKEEEFERIVVEHASHIFGRHALYIDVKRRISRDRVVTIPDGYLIDASFPDDPRLYIVENELSTHDAFRHVGQQLLKFAVSYRSSGRQIKQFLLDYALGEPERRAMLDAAVKRSGQRNVDAFLEHLIFDKPPAAVVVIDRLTPELDNVLSQLSMATDVIEFCSYRCDGEVVHRFTPFQQDVAESVASLRSDGGAEGRSDDRSRLDTVVVPAQAEGFQRVFLDEHAWRAIRMSSAMIPRIRYIAAYQVAPISAITHVAEVDRIERYEDTGKYVLYFERAAEEVGPIPLPKRNARAFVPQAPRYAEYDRLMRAKTLADVFG